jgi:hypothetical protein
MEIQQLLPLRFALQLDPQFRITAPVDINDRHALQIADLLMN